MFDNRLKDIRIVCLFVYVCVCVCVCVCVRVRACMHACVRACVAVYIQDLAVKLLIVFEKVDDGVGGHNVLIKVVWCVVFLWGWGGGGGRGVKKSLFVCIRMKLQPVLENKVCKHGYLCCDTNSTFSDQVFSHLLLHFLLGAVSAHAVLFILLLLLCLLLLLIAFI